MKMGKIEGLILSKLNPDMVLREIGYRLDTLQKKGERWKCFCPIHKERIFRSLTIDASTGRFTCGYTQCSGLRGGDLLTLFADSKEMSRADAVRFWAERMGLPVPEPEPEDEAPQEPAAKGPAPEKPTTDAEEKAEPVQKKTPPQEKKTAPSPEPRAAAPQESQPTEPLTPRGYLARFHNLRSSEDIDQAVQLLEAALGHYPKDLDLLDAAAEFRSSRGKTDEAHEALLQLAAAYRDQHSKEGELRTLKRALGLRADDPDTREAIVQLCVDQGMARDAIAYLYEGARLYEKAENIEGTVQCYQQITELDSEEVRAYQRLAEIHTAKNDREAASAALLALARLYEEREVLGKACNAYVQLLELTPDNTDARRELARLYSLCGKRDQATEANLKLADLLLRAQRHEEAVEVLKSVVEHQPDNGDVHSLLAATYEQLGRSQEALEQHLAVASIHEREGNTSKAVQLYTRIHQESPTNRNAFRRLVRLLIQQEKKIQAQELLRRQVEVEQRQGEGRHAAEWLRALLDLEPADTETAIALVRTLSQHKTAAEVVEFVRSHAQFLASSTSTRKALQLLEALPPDMAKIEAIQSIREALKPFSTSEQPGSERSLDAAQRALAEGLYEEARRRFQEARQLGADSVTTLGGLFQAAVGAADEAETASILPELFAALGNEGREDEAVLFCLEALDRHPNNEGLRKQCFAALKQAGHQEELASALAARLVSAPGEYAIALELAELHQEREDLPAALSVLDAAAQHQLEEGNPELAGQIVRRALAIDPDEEKRHASLAESLARGGRTDEAAEVLVSLARRRRSQGRIPEAGHVLARAFAYSNSYLPALKEDFEASLESRDDGWVRRGARRLARAYASTELHGKAIETLTRARRLLPEDPVLLEEALSVYEEMGAVDRAVESIQDLIGLRKMEGDDEAVLSLCRRGLGLAPTNLSLWEELACTEESVKGLEACEETLVRLASVYRDKGLNGKRLEVLARLRETFPLSGRVWTLSLEALDETGNQSEMAGVLAKQAHFLREDGDLGAARETLHRALAVSPDSVTVLRNLADVCLAMDDTEAAVIHFGALCDKLHSDPPPTDSETLDVLIQSYQQILDLAPDLSQPRLRLAGLYYHQRRSEEAAAIYRDLAAGNAFELTLMERQQVLERLVQLEPQDFSALWQLALLHRERADRDREIACLEALSNRAGETNELELVIQARSRLAELAPGEARYWQGLGEALERAERNKEASEALGKAATIYLQRGDFATAEPILVRLTESGTDSPELLAGLARAAERNGRAAEAAGYLVQVAGVLIEREETEAAVEHLRHACELEPHRREYKVRLLEALAEHKSFRRAVGVAKSLVASAQEEEERLRVLAKVLEWKWQDPEIVESVLPAFENLYPGREGIQLLVDLLARGEDLAEKAGAAPMMVNPPDAFLKSKDFWGVFISATKGRSLGIPQYVQGVSSLLEQEEPEQARAACECGLKGLGDVRALLERYLGVLDALKVEEEQKIPVVERLCAACEETGDREAAARYRRMIRAALGEDGGLEQEEAEEAAAESRERARQYAEAGSPHDALAEWQKVLAAVPGDSEALEHVWDLSARIGDMDAARHAGQQMAEAACLRGDAQDGIRWFERVLERLPGDHETCQRLAELCVGLGRRQEGIEYVRRLTTIYRQRGWQEEERQALERLRVLEPEDVDLDRLAALYEETSRERAVEIYRTVLEQAERSNDVARASQAAMAILRLAEGGGEAMCGLAARLEKLGENERARNAYREAAEWFQQAGDGMKALECYRSMQRLGERGPGLYVTMAEIYQMFGNLVESESCLWQAWEIHEAEGETEQILELAGRVFALQTDNFTSYARAIGYLDSVAEEIPAESLGRVREDLLAALARHPSSERGREILGEISQRWPSDRTVTLELLCSLGDLLLEVNASGATTCWLAIARRAWDAGNEPMRDRALEVLRGLELPHQDREAVIDLWIQHEKAGDILPEMLSQMETLQRLGHLDQALETTERILEIDPANERAHQVLPDLLERCGDPVAARAARLKLAERLLESDKPEEAISCARDLLNRYSNDEENLRQVKALYAAAEHAEGLKEVGWRQVELNLEEGRYDRAMDELEELRGQAGESPDLIFKMAEVAKLQGDRAREQELYRRGAKAYSLHEDFGRAVEKYRSLLDENPAAAEIRLDLAQLLWDKGFPEDAKREQSQAVELLLQQEKWEVVREAADALLAWAPDDLGVLEAAVRWAERDEDVDRQRRLLGRLAGFLVARGERERAVSVYRELVSWSPDDLDLRQDLAGILSQLKRPQEATQELLALAHLAREQEDRPRAAEAAEAAWRINPESREASALLVLLVEEDVALPEEAVTGAFVTLARSAVATGDHGEAEDWISRGGTAGIPAEAFKEIQNALREQRQREVEQPEEGVEARVEEAAAVFEAGDLDRGRELFESLVAQSPSDLILVKRYAQALVRAGQADDAFHLLEQKAESLERADDYEGASYCLEQLIELQPQRVEPMLRLGRLQCLARDEKGAWNTFSQVLDIVLSGERPKEEQQQAAAVLGDYVSRLPDSTEVWERVFELQNELGHRSQALTALKSIHRLAHQTGRTLEAIDALERVLRIYPVSLRRDDWRAPQDWVEEDASMEWVRPDEAAIGTRTDPEDIRLHLRHRLELATYHLRHGLQDAGTQELVMAGEIARIHGLGKQAKKFYLESLKWLRHLGERTGQRTVWHGLLEVNLALGDLDAARRTVRSWAAWEEEQGELERSLEVRKTYLESEPKDLSVREDLVARAWEWDYAEMGWEQGLILGRHLQEKDLFGRAEALYRGLLQRAKEPRFAPELADRIGEVRQPLLQLLRDRGDHAAVAELRRMEAREASQADDHAQAAALLEEILVHSPDDTGLLEELCDCHRRAGNDDSAFEYQMQLARLHRSSGMIQKALELGRDMVKARPEDEEALSLLTTCYREASDVSGASVFYWQIANLLNKDGKLSASVPILHQIEDLAQRAPDNWLMLAQTWTELKETERAGRAYYHAGLAALASGNQTEAVSRLEKARDLIPDDGDVLEALKQAEKGRQQSEQVGRREDILEAAERARKSGDRSEACRLFDEYVNEYRDDVGAKEKLVELLAGLTGRQGGLAGSTAALSVRQRERLLELSEWLGKYHISSGEIARGVRYIKMAVELTPERLDLQRNLMEQYVALGLQSEAARQGMDLAARLGQTGNASGAISVYRDILKLDPDNVEASNALALQLVETENSAEAKQEYRRLAEIYAQRELLGKAITSLQSAVTLDPENEELRQRMAQLYAQKGNTSAALDQLKIIEERCRKRQELEKAADVLTEMIRLDPERGSIRERLAETFSELGDRLRACEVYRDLAHLYHERELPGRMIEAAEKALAIDGEDRDLSRMMVEAYRERGDGEVALQEARRMAGLVMQRSAVEGERLYRDILEWAPDDADSLLALAQCCQRQHRDSEASDHFEHLGRLCQSHARFLEATRMWRQALELNGRKIALKEELAEVYLDLGDEYHGHLLLEELAEHYEDLGEYEESVNRWVRLADRHIQKAMELPA